MIVMAEQLGPIWDGVERPDLYREYQTEQLATEGVVGNLANSKTILISCRSNKKLVWMKGRLENSTFTSFWP